MERGGGGKDKQAEVVAEAEAERQKDRAREERGAAQGRAAEQHRAIAGMRPEPGPRSKRLLKSADADVRRASRRWMSAKACAGEAGSAATNGGRVGGESVGVGVGVGVGRKRCGSQSMPRKAAGSKAHIERLDRAEQSRAEQSRAERRTPSAERTEQHEKQRTNERQRSCQQLLRVATTPNSPHLTSPAPAPAPAPAPQSPWTGERAAAAAASLRRIESPRQAR
ncbi:hypothetical protein L207DRAFT_534403 [Hyaloscypha variabilis F]|uniref:Uncharacterized protein n=1 Tax=Hyaloscypha variabilis (strain UAMH 11265 / GT02V1 / F) TaxID=1149755 RepID=A0A2J6R682_HYAVF|nr:hypothetical protein L207DRAFT_534403 [Hyaloscypha variabilis F]